MTYVPHGPKKPIELMLSEDLVRAASLGPSVISLTDDASSGAIINAIDAVITRAYG
jgi:hypothetical protein